MARVVVLGAGIAGHTSAAFLRKWLGKDNVQLDSFKHLGWSRTYEERGRRLSPRSDLRTSPD